MRLLVVLFMFPLALLGQDRNEQIIDYVNSVVGKRVGRGICRNLSQAVVKRYGDKSKVLYREHKKYGVRIDSSEVIPGDLIILKGCRWENGSAMAHIGIVYNVYPDGSMDIAEQNVGTGRKNLFGYVPGSVVVISEYDFSKMIKGKVRFYRVI
jgi:hypothetical protein